MTEEACRGCGQAIIKIKAENGKTVPVNAEPVWVRLTSDGGLFLTAGGRMIHGVIVGDAMDLLEVPVERAYIPHKGMCPTGGRRPRNRVRRNGRYI